MSATEGNLSALLSVLFRALPPIPSLLNATLADIADGLDRQRFTSVDLVNAYLARIKEVNDDFKAVCEVNPDALQVASALDEERLKSERRGLLHGIPLLLKENIGTSDRVEAAAGSLALVGAKPAQESTVAKKLRDAGAVMLGTTAMTEWANARGTNTGNGWSPRGGQCRGAPAPDMDPSGSSSGSAVATSLGLALATIGTETDGSITSPAAKAGVMGIKPTIGLVARDGVVPISYTHDTVGPIVRSVKDGAAILSVIAGKSPMDDKTSQIPFQQMPDYVAACGRTDLKGIRLGIPRGAFDTRPKPVEDQFQVALDALRKAGAEIVDDATIAGSQEYRDLPSLCRNMTVLFDYRDTLNSYFESLVTNPQNIHNVGDLIEFIKKTPEEDYPHRNLFFFEEAQKIGPTHYEYTRFKERQQYFATEGGIPGAIDKWRVDALVAPAVLGPISSLSAIGGCPVVSMPLGVFPEGTEKSVNGSNGLIEEGPGLPFAITFHGKPFSDEKLISIAHVFEQIHNVSAHVKPFKTPRIDLKDIIGAGMSAGRV